MISHKKGKVLSPVGAHKNDVINAIYGKMMKESRKKVVPNIDIAPHICLGILVFAILFMVCLFFILDYNIWFLDTVILLMHVLKIKCNVFLFVEVNFSPSVFNINKSI